MLPPRRVWPGPVFGVTVLAAAVRIPGARLLGLDFSPAGVAAARGRAASVDIAEGAAFCVGNITAAGVGTGAADAVVYIETIMFAGAHLDALRECRRLGAAPRAQPKEEVPRSLKRAREWRPDIATRRLSHGHLWLRPEGTGNRAPADSLAPLAAIFAAAPRASSPPVAV